MLVLFVLTVPMRNGNLTIVPIIPKPPRVLTVPMRNGNSELREAKGMTVEFLPYL